MYMHEAEITQVNAHYFQRAEAEVRDRIGPGEVQALAEPAPASHKGMNGQVLIVAGSERYHGALVLATRAASKVADLVFVSSVPRNNALIRHVQSEVAEFIAVPRNELKPLKKRVDAVLIGPGLGTGGADRRLVEQVLRMYRDHPVVLDADALTLAPRELYPASCVITPHAGEFHELFGMDATPENVQHAARECGCTIVLKGDTDHVSNGEICKHNALGNAGMTKGGTGDVLAGVIAALMTSNSPFLAARAGVFLNGLAAHRLFQRVSYYYSASDLLEEIPHAFAGARNV